MQLPTRCRGHRHVWIWPMELEQSDGEPPSDWPCMCGELYPNGEPVNWEEEIKQTTGYEAKPKFSVPTGPGTGRCSGCGQFQDDHPTRTCGLNWL